MAVVGRRRVWLSWSSGKDSAFALSSLRRSAETDVVGLLTTFDEAADRVAMHAVRRGLAREQARSCGLPLVEVDLPAACSNDEYERRVAAALDRGRSTGVTHVAFGDLFLEDVRAYRERQVARSGLEPLFPLWGRDTARLARGMIEDGFRAIVTCVDPRRISAAFAGRAFDDSLLDELPA
ncbi:MAG: ATP-binding protein, partial [Planctomycetota bacterium JB042]